MISALEDTAGEAHLVMVIAVKAELQEADATKLKIAKETHKMRNTLLESGL